MADERSPRLRGWRAILLMLVGSMMGAQVITPAVADFQSNVGHIFGHVQDKLKYVQKVSDDVEVPAGSSEFLSIGCGQSREPVGGGVDTLQDNLGHATDLRIVESYPSAHGWQALVVSESASTKDAHIWVICVQAE